MIKIILAVIVGIVLFTAFGGHIAILSFVQRVFSLSFITEIFLGIVSLIGECYELVMEQPLISLFLTILAGVIILRVIFSLVMKGD